MNNELLLTSVYKRAAVSFLFLTIALLGLVAYVVLPNALIVITPSIGDFEKNYFFTVTPEATGSDEIPGARLVSEIVLEQSYAAQGKEEVLTDITGTITLVNNYSRSQPLVRTTRLLTEDGILLRLDEAVTLPAGGSVEAAVYLDDNSVTTSVLEEGRLTIPGLWEGIQDRIYGEITTPLQGTTEVASIVMTDDITQAQDDLRAKAEAEVVKELTKALTSSQLVPESVSSEWEPVIINAIDESWDISEDLAGSSASTFSIAGTFVFEGVFYNETLLSERVDDQLRKEANAQARNVSSSETRLTETDLDTPQTELLVIVSGKEKSVEKENFFEENPVAGLTKEEAIAYLSGLDGVEDVKIELSPFWVKKIPKNKIDLVILNN